MSKLRVIDLLNKIANGEELPKKVKYSGVIFENEDGDLLNDIDCSLFEHRGDENEKLLPMLNDEVEILEEEKKIPEKLEIEQDKPGKQYYIRNEYGTKCGLTQHSRMIAETLNEVIDYLDYLKSKGE